MYKVNMHANKHICHIYHTYIHKYIHTHTNIHTYMHTIYVIHTYIHRAYIHIHTYTHYTYPTIHTCMYIQTYIHTHMIISCIIIRIGRPTWSLSTLNLWRYNNYWIICVVIMIHPLDIHDYLLSESLRTEVTQKKLLYRCLVLFANANNPTV